MLDINRIQSNPEELKEMLKKRCMDDTSLVDRLNVIIQNKKKASRRSRNSPRRKKQSKQGNRIHQK